MKNNQAAQSTTAFFQNRSGLARPGTAAPSETLPLEITQLLKKPVSYYKELAQSPQKDGSGPLTNVVFVLDTSSSMAFGKELAIDGFNAQIAAIRKGAKEAGKTLFTEVQFDSVVTLRNFQVDIDEMQDLTAETYPTRGSTALFDAIGKTVAKLLTTQEAWRDNTATLVTIFTDGEENSSTQYDQDLVSKLIKRLEATGRWTFALVGPSRTVAAMGSSLEFRASNVTGYDVSSLASKAQAFSKVTAASTSYLSMRAMGATQAENLFDPSNEGLAQDPGAAAHTNVL